MGLLEVGDLYESISISLEPLIAIMLLPLGIIAAMSMEGLPEVWAEYEPICMSLEPLIAIILLPSGINSVSVGGLSWSSSPVLEEVGFVWAEIGKFKQFDYKVDKDIIIF